WIYSTVSTPVQAPLGSLLIDAYGTKWTILEVRRIDVVKVWKVRCRNLSVVYNLDNLASVLEACYAKSPGGEVLPTWTQILSGIPARFQPVRQEAQILEDSEWPK